MDFLRVTIIVALYLYSRFTVIATQRKEMRRNFSRSYEKSKAKEDNDQLSKSSGFVFLWGYYNGGPLFILQGHSYMRSKRRKEGKIS